MKKRVGRLKRILFGGNRGTLRNKQETEAVFKRLGWKEELLDQEFRILQYRRSISSKKSCGVLMKKIGDQEQSLQLHWKGPASTILGMCTHFYDNSGKIQTMENDQEEKFGKVIKEMEDKGLRPIAFAFGEIAVEELKKEGLSLLAIMGLKYPCREDIKLLVATLPCVSRRNPVSMRRHIKFLHSLLRSRVLSS